MSSRPTEVAPGTARFAMLLGAVVVLAILGAAGHAPRWLCEVPTIVVAALVLGLLAGAEAVGALARRVRRGWRRRPAPERMGPIRSTEPHTESATHSASRRSNVRGGPPPLSWQRGSLLYGPIWGSTVFDGPAWGHPEFGAALLLWKVPKRTDGEWSTVYTPFLAEDAVWFGDPEEALSYARRLAAPPGGSVEPPPHHAGGPQAGGAPPYLVREVWIPQEVPREAFAFPPPEEYPPHPEYWVVEEWSDGTIRHPVSGVKVTMEFWIRQREDAEKILRDPQ